MTVFLYACGQVRQDPSTAEWELVWTRGLQWVGIYHLFGFLWTVQARALAAAIPRRLGLSSPPALSPAFDSHVANRQSTIVCGRGAG